MHGEFFLLEKNDGQMVRAERLALGETSGRNEAWLRDVLYEAPELLPVNEFDPAFGSLIPLCTELRTEAGPVDIAYINPFGRLALVECKLWRNPESRRKVIAQVLDYARAITRWSYSDLQRQVSAATGKPGNVPYELARLQNPKLEERKFVDATVSAMRSGKFLLLIAGDGIREDVSSMSELINRNAALGFSFGLIEVGLYGLPDGGLIAQPRTVAKTQLVERTVFLVKNDAGDDLATKDEECFYGQQPAEKVVGESSKHQEFREWWAPIQSMAFDDPDQEQPKLYWPNNVRTPLPYPRTWLLAYRSGGDSGKIAVCTSGSAEGMAGLFSLLESEEDEIVDELPEGTEVFESGKGGAYFFATIRAANEFKSESEKRNWIKSTLNSYANVLRPRIKRLLAE